MVTNTTVYSKASFHSVLSWVQQDSLLLWSTYTHPPSCSLTALPPLPPTPGDSLLYYYQLYWASSRSVIYQQHPPHHSSWHLLKSQSILAASSINKRKQASICKQTTFPHSKGSVIYTGVLCKTCHIKHCLLCTGSNIKVAASPTPSQMLKVVCLLSPEPQHSSKPIMPSYVAHVQRTMTLISTASFLCFPTENHLNYHS